MKRTPLRRRGYAPNRARRLRQFGTPKRRRWWREHDCACISEGRDPHHACLGDIVPSHVRSRGAGGEAGDIIPQSVGCHGYIGYRGWARWELETGVDARALADKLATQGPDAPRGEAC